MTILIIILVIIAIPLIGAAFLSKAYVIEREITINRSQQDVFNYIRLLKNQVNYNKWTMADPNVKLAYTGTDGTVGFISAWESENKSVGKGEQEIKKISEGSRMDTELRFIKPFENTAGSYMIVESLPGNQSRVKWGLTGSRSYANKIMHFLLNLKKMLAKDMDEGLNTLKKVQEK